MVDSASTDSIRARTSSRDVLAFVWGYWRRLPLRLALIASAVLVAVTLEVQIPDRAARLVTDVERFMSGADSIDAAWAAIGALILLYAGVALTQQLYMRLWMHFAAEVMQRIVADGFERVQRFSSDWHANHFAGSTQRKITRGMWAYDSMADIIVIDLGPTLALLFGFSIAMTLRSAPLGAFFALAVVVFIAVSMVLSLRYVAPANQQSNDADTELGGALADAITCNPVVKSFGAERREDAELWSVAGRWRQLARRSWTRSVDAGALQSAMLLTLLASLLSMVLGLAAAERASMADIVYVITTYFIVSGHLRTVGWQVRNLQRAINELDDLVAFAKTKPQVADAEGALPFRPGAGEIAFDSVRFQYANQPEPTFDELSVRIAPGEKVALVGESGAGKTSFVKLVQRLYDVDAGTIRIDGQDVSGVTQDSLRTQISLVPQDPILFHRSLAENIRYAKPRASQDEVIEAARRSHAHAFISKLELGYDTLVGERGIKLSGGERQRVAIARAILADTPVLILDEATSSLDSITEQGIQRAIHSLIEGRTALLIAHRLSTIRSADRILVFDDGRIVEQGTHEELMGREEGAYRRMFDMQTLGFVDPDKARLAPQSPAHTNPAPPLLPRPSGLNPPSTQETP